MKYVNAIITPYAKVSLDDETGAILSLTAPLATLHAITGNDGSAYLPRFETVTDLTFLGTTEEACAWNNPVCSGKKIDIAIRLTRCSDNAEERVYVDLDSFSVDLARARQDRELKRCGLEFYNICKISRFPERFIRLPSGVDGPAYGSYALKVIAQEHGSLEQPSVQGISVIEILA